LRGFIKLLQNTPHYQQAFKKIGDEKLQSQINAFVGGKSTKEALGESGFKISDHPSAGVKHHFSLLASLKKLVVGCFSAERAIESDINELVKPEQLQNLPIVFEDEAKKKVMEVAMYSPLFISRMF
jgi:hypothetical protein